MKRRLCALVVSLLFEAAVATAQQASVTIAAVNNPDMLELKKLSSKSLKQNPTHYFAKTKPKLNPQPS